MRYFWVVLVLSTAACTICLAEPVQTSFDLVRHAFYTDETILLKLICVNGGPESFPGGLLVISAKPDYKLVTREVGSLAAGESRQYAVRLDCSMLKAGSYELEAKLETAAGSLAPALASVTLARRPNPDRLLVWLWGGGGNQWYVDHGFNTWSGPYGTHNCTDDSRQLMDEALCAGAWAGLTPNGSLRDIDPAAIPDPDAAFASTPQIREEKVANPFHPEVARIQNEQNKNLMEFVRDFPQVRTAFFNTEIVDSVGVNTNQHGLQLMREKLGFTPEEVGDPKWVAPGVLADDDRAYLLHKYRYKLGNGVPLANQRTAEMIHRYRPDIITVNDPYRETCLLDMFPGIDVIGTWTYTNPDPKLMLYIETLRAACKPAGQIPLNTVTLLNYPGELAPTEEWMLMGAGRLAVTTWINLSRAPRIVGYYYSSSCNPENTDTNQTPYSTSVMLKTLADRVFKPYGPLLTNLDVAPRRIGVLSSAASQVHSSSPNLLGGYGNMQIYHFYTVMAMAHLQADVLFDETVERFGLDDYDVLVLPKCDALPQGVYDKILEFSRRGGTVVSDQYLKADIPGVIRFDFDFTYRKKVSANAIVNNIAYAQWNDHLQPGAAELEKVTGVTALDDQKILESYAARLKSELKGKVEPDMDCDAPTVLFNLLEKGPVKYLVIINDKRDYDDREGRYKAVLGKVLPQTANIAVRKWPHHELIAYDMIDQKQLNAERGEDGWHFQVALDELGGKLVALYPASIASISVHAAPAVLQNQRASIDVTLRDAVGNLLPGLQPVQVRITDSNNLPSAATDYYCARDGRLNLCIPIAINDAPGKWQVEARDLTAGMTATNEFEVLTSPTRPGGPDR